MLSLSLIEKARFLALIEFLAFLLINEALLLGWNDSEVV